MQDASTVTTKISTEEWKKDFKAVLDSLDSAGDFCIAKDISDSMPALHPKIRIQGMQDERIAFPLVKSQAEQIRATAEKAPFGKGMDTVVDEKVRKAWHFDSSKIEFDQSAEWNKILEKIVQDAAEGLGLKGDTKSSVQANLHKLLLYEQGGHFEKHRDTEKEPGMFGTLVIQLPSKFTGGSLLIEHRSEKKTIDFSFPWSQDGFFATAFFADCKHSLEEVTSGWRLCLVYNLIMINNNRSSTGTNHNMVLPSADGMMDQTKTLHRLAKTWASTMSASTSNTTARTMEPAQGCVLEHDYTETNLNFQQLKGRDRDVVDTLRNAKDAEGQSLFVVCLVLLEKHESGSAEYEDYGYGLGGFGSMDDVQESSLGTSLWIGPDGKKMEKFGLEFDLESCLMTDEEIDDLFGEDPDKEESDNYTGNAGPTIEHWHYHAAVTFWPREKNLEIMQEAGFPYLLSYLAGQATAAEMPALVSKVVAMLEEGERVTVQTIRALQRSKDANTVWRAFNKILLLGGNTSLAMVQAMILLDNDDLNQAAMSVIQRTFTKKHNCSGIAAEACQFASLLAMNGYQKMVPRAREAVVEGALQNIDIIFTSEGTAKAITTISFHTTKLGRFIKAVIGKANSSVVRAVLVEILSTQGAIENTDVLILAKYRRKQLVRATEKGPPTLSW